MLCKYPVEADKEPENNPEWLLWLFVGVAIFGIVCVILGKYL